LLIVWVTPQSAIRSSAHVMSFESGALRRMQPFESGAY
jgi:hypothetical protein